MLVLNRKPDQSVLIGEGANEIRLTIIEVRGDQVRLGFEGPREVRIVREEVLDRSTGMTTGPTNKTRLDSVA